MLENPSFEAVPAEGTINGTMPDGWYDCGFPGETIVDIHPKQGGGQFQVTLPPNDGKSYLGLVTRENNTWEKIGQRLSSPFQAGTTYDFSIYLSRSLAYVSASKSSKQPVNFAVPLTLRIWGGFDTCDRTEILAKSEPVIDANWEEYQFELSPTQNFTHIVLEAFYKTPTPFPYNGNLLIDNASDIVPVSFGASTPEVAPVEMKEEKEPVVPLTEADRHEFSRPFMGTDFRIVAYYPDSVLLKEAVEKAYARVGALQKVFSDYDENSEVSWLSNEGKGDVSDELWDVLSYSQEVSERSEGAFDVSVGALSKLWRRAIRQKEFPSTGELNQAAATVGYKDIKMKGGKKFVKLGKEGMRLDFGGIAVGYAVDEAMAWLNEYGIYVALVDGGGDILVGQAPPGKAGWEIDKPDKIADGELTFKKTYLANTAITTSGDTYRYLEYEGKRYSHIIDPRTGMGLTNRRIATVTAPTCIAADAWATAACVGIKKLLMVDLKKENIKISILEE